MERATEWDGVDFTTVALVIAGNDDAGTQLVFVGVAEFLEKSSGDLGGWRFGILDAKNDVSGSLGNRAKRENESRDVLVHLQMVVNNIRDSLSIGC